MQEAEFILYVKDQALSRDFYKTVLQAEPELDVPGMCEFRLNSLCKLGLMPATGIAKILADKTPSPQSGHGIPRAELYLKVSNPEAYYLLSLQAGAVPVQKTTPMDWGDEVAYVTDPDGHVLAFARSIPPKY